MARPRARGFRAKPCACARAIEKFDATNGAARREFLDEGIALIVVAQKELQAPARRGLLMAAENAAASAEEAEETLARTGIAVMAVVLVVSIVLMFSITPRCGGSPR